MAFGLHANVAEVGVSLAVLAVVRVHQVILVDRAADHRALVLGADGTGFHGTLLYCTYTARCRRSHPGEHYLPPSPERGAALRIFFVGLSLPSWERCGGKT